MTASQYIYDQGLALIPNFNIKDNFSNSIMVKLFE
jgi:hypothetical protein